MPIIATIISVCTNNVYITIMKNHHLNLILFTLVTLLQLNCVYTSTERASVNLFRDLENIYYLMENNYLSTRIDDIFKTRECTLNPGKIITENETYYILRFFYSSYVDTFIVNEGDSILITVNGRKINLKSNYVIVGDNEITAYYEVPVLDLIEISLAKSVTISVKSINDTFYSEFQSQNFANFDNFIKSYVYTSNDNLNNVRENQLVKSKLRGFISIGAGSGYELWFTYYTNILKIKAFQDIGDFISFGAGFTKFTYDRYVHRQTSSEPPPRFWYEYYDSHKNSIWYLNTMYGLTHSSGFGNWSVELGVTVQYYKIDDKDWNKYIPSETSWGTVPKFKYNITNGKAYDGFVFGIFVQAGIFWFRINLQESWMLGLSVPIYN